MEQHMNGTTIQKNKTENLLNCKYRHTHKDCIKKQIKINKKKTFDEQIFTTQIINK